MCIRDRLEPLLDFTKAKDNEILVHPEDNWEALCPVGADNKRNLCAHDESSNGDIDKVLDAVSYTHLSYLCLFRFC